MSLLLDLLIAAGLGGCLARASLCAVAATQEAVVQGRYLALQMQLLAMASAGVVLLALCLRRGAVGLPGTSVSLLHVAVAAGVMAIGALINGGCYLGSILYLGRGKSNFLFSLLGIALAARADLASVAGLGAQAVPRPLPGEALVLSFIVAFGIVAVFALWSARAGRAAGSDSRIVFTLLAGLFAGVLMHRLPGWGYNSALSSLGRVGLSPANAGSIALACALFAGAVASCIAAGQWRPELPDVHGALRCLAGGFLLESAARAIPGGNDGLLFWVMPGLGAYGFVAYGVILSLLLLVWSAATRRAGV